MRDTKIDNKFRGVKNGTNELSENQIEHYAKNLDVYCECHSEMHSIEEQIESSDNSHCIFIDPVNKVFFCHICQNKLDNLMERE